MLAVIVLVITVLATGAAPAWLDASSPLHWNVAGAPLPAAPGERDPDLAPGGRCAAMIRPPSTPEDRAAVAKGWSLFGPYERYGATSVLMVTSSADGMCRPTGFQGFVFENDVFAGTLSPHMMEARSDASIAGLGIDLDEEMSFEVTFVRYAASDPLCCPHASTSVMYKIENQGGHSVVQPVSTQTNKN